MSKFLAVLLAPLALASEESSGISKYDLALADKYVHFSGAAYCANPKFKNEQISKWTCAACQAYPGMQATTFTSSKECNGFVGYYPKDNEIVVSFSGTDPLYIQQWIDDLDFFKTDYPLCSGCKVHEGFYKTYLSAVDTIRNLTQSYVSQHPTATITCTGHSLGGALAAHCAADLNNIYGSTKTMTSPYTFGMPRVGEQKFSDWFKSTALPFETYRVTHRKDPVPQLPFQAQGFHHFPYEVFYKDNYKQYTICSVEGEDSNCSNQYLVNPNVFDHLEYNGFDFISNWAKCEF